MHLHCRFIYFAQLDHRMQNAKQAYCNTFSDEYVEVAENDTQPGDCQIVLMEDTEEHHIEFVNDHQLNNDNELAEEVTITIHFGGLQRICFLGYF